MVGVIIEIILMFVYTYRPMSEPTRSMLDYFRKNPERLNSRGEILD